jgi:hypothetical protein
LETFLNSCCGTAFSAVVTFFLTSSIPWNLRLFKADFVFGNSRKSFAAKSGEKDGRFISVIDFWGHKLLDRERLVSWDTVIVENPIVRPKFRPF